MSEFASVEEALAELKAGKMILVVDDPDRENEGVHLTTAAMRGRNRTSRLWPRL